MIQLIAALLAFSPASGGADPLPSWNDGASKKAIVEFVGRVTKPGGADFVPERERIATFDNDGTLWAEQPIHFQLAFALDRVKALAPHPEWQRANGKEPMRRRSRRSGRRSLRARASSRIDGPVE